MINEQHPGRVYHFPRLHRGDCFYDILSRYHAQSGHLTFRATSQELFGTTPDLAPTITLPYRAEMIRAWMGQESATTPELIRDQHSAWPYLQLSNAFSEEDLLSIIRACPRPGRGRQGKMIYALQGGNAFLRYCPLCLVSDYLQESEPFWHLVHQLHGVKYCPIHGIRLIEDDIYIYEHLHRYVTAAEVLSASSIEEQLAWASRLETQKDPYYSSYLALGKTIAWILEHGLELGNRETLQKIYNQRLGFDEDHPLCGASLQKLLFEAGGMDFLKSLYPGEMYEVILRRAAQGLGALYPLEHALVITSLGVSESM